MRKYLTIYTRRLLVIYHFAAAPFWISLHMRKIWYSFLSVHKDLDTDWFPQFSYPTRSKFMKKEVFYNWCVLCIFKNLIENKSNTKNAKWGFALYWKQKYHNEMGIPFPDPSNTPIQSWFCYNHPVSFEYIYCICFC